MDIHLSVQQEARLREIASQTGRSTDEIVQEFVQSQLDHDAWFRAEVKLGMEELDGGHFVTHEEVLQELAPYLKK